MTRSDDRITYSCTKCSEADIESPLDHFANKHPGTLAGISLGDVHNSMRVHVPAPRLVENPVRKTA